MSARLLSLQDIATARARYATGYWRADTIYDLLRQRAGRTPQATALVDSAGSYTYLELLQYVDTLAATLHDAGLRPGDRIANWSPSRMESAAGLLAASRMGYVFVPSLHRDDTPQTVTAILERTGAAALIAERGYGGRMDGRDILTEAAGLAGMKAVVPLAPLVTDAGADMERFGGMAAGGRRPPESRGHPDRIGYLAFTSGTTGQPKGVMHSDNTLLSNARAIVADFGFDAGTVVYSFSPMSHNMGTVSLMVALTSGGKLVMHSPLDAARAPERVAATGATYLVGVPTHGIDLVERLGPGERLGAASLFQLAGAPVPARLARDLIGRGVKVQNCYGMTENCSFLYTRLEDPIEVVTETCGRPCAGMELAVFDPDDRERPVPHGTPGELAVRGASQMLGYFDDQKTTEMALNADGWFMTGDLGLIDANGNVRITGREKDIIIRGGKNIHPARAEELAMRHPAILKAAAFPVPDERLGERMCLSFVVKTGAAPPPPEALLTHLADQGLPKGHMPEYVVEMREYPLTGSGKILKRELVEMVRRGELAPCRVSRLKS